MNRYHIIRATLESIAYQVNDVVHAMQADSGISLSTLNVDGGASANDFLMQVQADICNAPVKSTGMRRDNGNGSGISCRAGRWILEGQRRCRKELGD